MFTRVATEKIRATLILSILNWHSVILNNPLGFPASFGTETMTGASRIQCPRLYVRRGIVRFVRKRTSMSTHQSPEQKKTVQRVMHEFKHGELKTARGSRKVKNPRQAIAIALREAGASKYQSSKKNAANLRHTKAKERRGETYQDETEGHRATQRSYRRAVAKSTDDSSKGNNKTRAQLYAEARRRNIPNRSKMNKAELERALHHH